MSNQTRTTSEKQTKNALSPNIKYISVFPLTSSYLMDNKIDLFQKDNKRVVYVDKSPYLVY